MGVNRRLSNTENWMNGTQGVNLAFAMFNQHYDEVNRGSYPIVRKDHRADPYEDKIKLSYDDDFFQASYWHKYYRICNRKHRLERRKAYEKRQRELNGG